MLSTTEIAQINLNWLGTQDLGPIWSGKIPTSVLSTAEIARIDLEWLGTWEWRCEAALNLNGAWLSESSRRAPKYPRFLNPKPTWHCLPASNLFCALDQIFGFVPNRTPMGPSSLRDKGSCLGRICGPNRSNSECVSPTPTGSMMLPSFAFAQLRTTKHGV